MFVQLGHTTLPRTSPLPFSGAEALPSLWPAANRSCVGVLARAGTALSAEFPKLFPAWVSRLGALSVRCEPPYCLGWIFAAL